MLEFRLRQRVIKVVRHGDPRQLTKGSPHGFHRLKSCDGSAVAGDGDRNTGAFNFGKQRIEPVLGLSAGDRGGGRHICIVYQLGLVALVALARLVDITELIGVRSVAKSGVNYVVSVIDWRHGEYQDGSNAVYH